MLSTRDHLETRDTYRLKVKGWKKLFHANRDQKKAGVAILISDKIDFKIKAPRALGWESGEGHTTLALQQSQIPSPLAPDSLSLVHVVPQRSIQSYSVIYSSTLASQPRGRSLYS